MKFYITTPIFYANAKLHLGHALTLIATDVLARYNKLAGKETFFLTGLDEHGAKIARAAEAAGRDKQEFVDELSEDFKLLLQKLNISNDDFIRTTDQKRHWPAVHKVWKKLKDQGDLYKAKYQGLYCVGHETFIKKSDLKGGICWEHKMKPEKIEEENYFFKLTKYKDEVKRLLWQDKIKILPPHRKNEALQLIKDSEDISFSRPRKDIKWGVPVPDDPEHTIYVWTEALVNYLSAVGYVNETPQFKKFWPADIHVMAKEILRFHAIIWPAMLLALNIELPKALYVHDFITIEEEKISKTVGNVINPVDLVKKYGVDPVRYYLVREFPYSHDSDFSYRKFELRHNADLANNLGNLVSRTVTLIDKYFNGRLSFSEKLIFGDVNKKIKGVWKEYDKNISEFKLHTALSNIFELSDFANLFIDEHKPWTLSGQPEHLNEVMNNLVAVLLNIAWLLKPFLPETSDKICDSLGVEKNIESWDMHDFKIKKAGILFPKLERS